MVSIVKRNRRLERDEDVFTQNAWDDTVWTDDMREDAERRIKEQQTEAKELATDRVPIIESHVPKKWDEFYQAHEDKFFKDRKWIFSEFAEIRAKLDKDSGPARLFEVGCGVGNAVSYVIASNQNTQFHVFCCDLSPSAIETLKHRQFYQSNCSNIDAFQCDICTDFSTKVANIIEPHSLDFITLIFALSAMPPEHMDTVITNLASLLKPNGMLMFRDYARYDLTQLRFKGKAYLSDNYYVRADGTTSYFFTTEFVHDLFARAGLNQVELKEDNRMLVNRAKQVKMCRRWIQAKYTKPACVEQT